MNLPEGKILVQFDGICILCSHTINFIIKADRHNKFLFQTLQDTPRDNVPESVVVYDGISSYTHFDAIMKIGKELGGIYRLAGVFRILPSGWRRSLYEWIAKNRYRWFGVRTTCYFPSSQDRERFI